MKVNKLFFLIFSAYIGFWILTSCSADKKEETSDNKEKIQENVIIDDKSILFLSTQMNPVEEANIMRSTILKNFKVAVDFQPNDNSHIFELLPYERKKDHLRSIIFGGLHGDFYTLSERDLLMPLNELYGVLNKNKFINAFVNFGSINSDNYFYIPWMQATYIMVINKKALDYLPEGVDPFNMTYLELKKWAKKIYHETGEKKLGYPAGEKGLLHRFLQGYLYPSYTGISPMEFDSHKAVAMWEDFRNLWNFVNPKSLFYMNMSDPLLSGEIWISWDHTARLIKALRDKPDDFIAIPAPRGPEGRGYITVLSGLGIPKELENLDGAIALIDYLTSEETQKVTLKNTGFFPVLKTIDLEGITKPMENLLKAVNQQSSSSDSIPTLLPIGLRERNDEFNSIYIETFSQIVLAESPVEEILGPMSNRIKTLINESDVHWW